MQYWPRKRAKSEVARVRYWADLPETKLLGFAGYKVGMTHVSFIDTQKTSLTKGMDINCHVTIIECPPIKAASIRFYQNSVNGLQPVSEIFSDKVDPELKRKIAPPKKIKKTINDIKLDQIADIRLLVYTQPKLTGIGKKKPELFEMAIAGSKDNKLKFAQEKLGKEITIEEVFNEGQQIDIHAITKGKGFQGPVKRFGIHKKQHKTEKGVRTPGSLGAWNAQGHMMYRIAHAGQMGYHRRTEYNKWLIKIGKNPNDINQKGGFLHYGVIKNPYILLKGSIPGPAKRLIRINHATRPNKGIIKEPPTLTYISIKAK